MKEEAFSTNMASAAANKLQPDNTLNEEAMRHWPEIFSRRRAFHVNVEEACVIKALQKSTVLKAYDEWFSTDGKGKACLTLTVAGGGKFNVEEEVRSLEANIKEEADGVSLRAVRIATPPELYSPSDGRDVFPPNLYG